jgi:hypothetical protein
MDGLVGSFTVSSSVLHGWVVVRKVYRKYCERVSEQVSDWIPFLHVFYKSVYYCALTCSLSVHKSTVVICKMAWHDKLLLVVLKKRIFQMHQNIYRTSFVLWFYVYKFVVLLVARFSVPKTSCIYQRASETVCFLIKTKRRKKCTIRHTYLLA